jgi:hypothetical protein
MKITAIILLSIGALVVALWLFYAIGMLIGVNRLTRRFQERAGLSGISSNRRQDFFPILVGSALMTFSAVVFLIGWCWYRVRGKPIPPPPQFRQKP